MKKIFLSAAAITSLAALSLVSIPAHADELPGNGDVPTATPTALAPTDYKVNFNWSVPQNPNGDPYNTCDVKFLRADGSIALEAPYPTSVEKLSFSFNSSDVNDDSIVPGVTTLSLNYTCSNNEGDTSDEVSVDSAVIPDVAPTAPTYVNASPAGQGTLDIAYGGAEALGRASLEGYRLDVLAGKAVVQSIISGDTSGGSMTLGTAGNNRTYVSGAKVSAKSVATTSTKKYGVLSTNFNGLPTGLYTVQVRAFNAVGLGDATQSREVLVQNTPKAATVLVVPGKVQSAKATKVTKSGATLTWKAPANNGAKSYTVLVGNKTYSTGAKTTLALSGLKAKTYYSVRIIAAGSMPSLTSTTSVSFTTAKAPAAVKKHAPVKKHAAVKKHSTAKKHVVKKKKH